MVIYRHIWVHMSVFTHARGYCLKQASHLETVDINLPWETLINTTLTGVNTKCDQTWVAVQSKTKVPILLTAVGFEQVGTILDEGACIYHIMCTCMYSMCICNEFDLKCVYSSVSSKNIHGMFIYVSFLNTYSYTYVILGACSAFRRMVDDTGWL